MAVNLTLSVDDRTLERAREIARQQGTSVNALIREYLERLAGTRSSAEILMDLERQWTQKLGRSGRRHVRRDELYEDRLGRARVR